MENVKKAICTLMPFTLLILILNFNIANASGYQLFNKSDLYLNNLGMLQLDNHASVNDASTILGDVVSYKIESNPAEYYINARMQLGAVWIDGVGDKSTPGEIGRLITKKADVQTSKGIKIGDSMQKLVERYGEPGYIRAVAQNDIYSSRVQQWYLYFYQDGVRRLIFGLDYNGNVYCIGYSVYPGGL